MTSKTHDLFAFGALLTAAVYYPPKTITLITLLVVLVANIVGALLPDIDQASNRLWDLLPGGDMWGKVLRRLFLSHRTLSHSFLGMYLIFKLVCWLVPKLLNNMTVDTRIVIVSLMIGYLSHLLADAFTEEGLPLLFPIKWKFGFPPIKSWRMKTGKWFENRIVFPLIMVYIFWFSWINLTKIWSILKLVKN